MPYANIHLLTAVRLWEACARPPRADYLAGALAPDAVHLRADYRPQMKADSHLVCRWEKHIDTGQWRRNVCAALPGLWATPFGRGYAVHLLVDVLWA